VLPPGDDAVFRAHLRGCDECRAHYDATMGVLRLARGGPTAFAPAEAERLTARAVALARPAPAPRPWWRWAVLPAAFVTAVALAILGWPRQPVGKVLVAGGGFTVDGAPGAKDAVLLAGAELVTDEADAAVLLEGPHGRRALLLRPHTRLKVPSADDAKLEAGRVRVQLKPGAEAFRVETPEGATVTSAGGVFVAERRDDNTMVAVHTGEARVDSADASVTLKAGQETQVDLSGALAPVRPASANALVEDRGGGSVWDAIVRFLRGIIDAIGKALGGD
jgi:ferric-dicitrate binding protein FerR (iron transport regulator)